MIGGLDARIEVGYAFARELQFADRPDVELTDTVLVRGGLKY